MLPENDFEHMLVDDIWSEIIGKDIDIYSTCRIFFGRTVDMDCVRRLLWDKYKVFQDPISLVWYQGCSSLDINP